MERVGKSWVYVTNLLRLLKLHDELRSLLAEGKLSIGHAKVLLGVEESAEQLKLDCDVLPRVGLLDAEDEVNALLNPKSGNSSVFRKTNNPFAGIAQQAESVLGRSVRIKGNSQGGGKMTLSFKDQTDLQNLLSHLGLDPSLTGCNFSKLWHFRDFTSFDYDRISYNNPSSSLLASSSINYDTTHFRRNGVRFGWWDS